MQAVLALILSLFAVSAQADVAASNTLIFKIGGTERARISSTGVTVNGVINATSFSGNGAGLTNLPVTTADRIVSGTATLVQDSGGILSQKTTTGNATFNMQGANDNAIQLGNGRTTSGYAYIDLIGDATYTDYGLRIIRDNAGANASSWIQHRGTGSLALYNSEAAPITFTTSGLERMRVAANGHVGIGITAPTNQLDISATSNQLRLVADEGVNASFNMLEGAGAGLDPTFDINLLGGDTSTTHSIRFFRNTNTTGQVNAMFLRGNNTTAAGAVINSNGTAPTYFNLYGDNFGIGTNTPAYPLDVVGTARASGEIMSNSVNSFRIANTTYGTFFRNDNSNFYLLSTVSGTPLGSYNSNRPFIANLVTGNVGIGGSAHATDRLNVAGTVRATAFVGDGSALTDVPGDNLGDHTATTTLNMGANKVQFSTAVSDKVYYYTNAYGRGIESSTLTDWSGSQFRWRIGGTSVSTGSQQMLLTLTGLNVSGSLSVNNDDAVTAPGFTWNGDTNTGMYWVGADQLGLTTGGVQRALVNSTGVTVTGAVAATTASGAWVATQAEAEAGADNTQVMTPLRTKQAIAAIGGGATYVKCSNTSTATACAGAKTNAVVYRPISCATARNNPNGEAIAGYFQFTGGIWQVYVNDWYVCMNGTLLVMDTTNIPSP